MKVTQMIEVNLSEGLFLDEYRHVVGAWSHNLKILIAKHPYTVIEDIINGLSAKNANLFESYQHLDGETDSFALSAWNPKTYSHAPLYEFIK